MAGDGDGARSALRVALTGLVVAAAMLVTSLAVPGWSFADPPRRFEGVASCGGTTCHGRLEADGRIVRQDELARWQEPSTQGGAHSRAFTILSGPRARQITATLGLGDPSAAPACLGCHSTPAAARGPRFRANDGVGCEACHGAASGWIASHYAVGASHAANVWRGMIALERPTARAGVCLDCHLGSGRPGQFVNHRMMSAGHPRLTFELDLFSTLQQHHNEDADYAARKVRSDGVQMWAVGQALAVNRALTLYGDPTRGSEGAFPEFSFFDCHSCHRQIYDRETQTRTWVGNPGRPIPAGMPPFNDENMILLSAAARVAAPALAGRFDADARAFHTALARDRTAAVAAGRTLATTATVLADRLAAAGTGGNTAFAMVDVLVGPALEPRFTDYTGSAQAVMAVDTLLNALVKQGRITIGAAAGIRVNINRAYAAVREPNTYRPAEFRGALRDAARAIRVLR